MKTSRFKEASTWASISAALAALSSVPVFATYTVPAAAICAAIGVLLREGEEEREMMPLCREEGIGSIPYSPLASGRLTRDWSSEKTMRSETDSIAKGKYDSTADADQKVVERVAELCSCFHFMI